MIPISNTFLSQLSSEVYFFSSELLSTHYDTGTGTVPVSESLESFLSLYTFKSPTYRQVIHEPDAGGCEGLFKLQKQTIQFRIFWRVYLL
jgi:hypothetical protein